MDHPEILHCLF